MKSPIIAICLAALLPISARADVHLSVLDTTGTNSVITAQAGQTITLEILVSGLTTNTPLASFDLYFLIPSQLTFSSFNAVTLPTGWDAPYINTNNMLYGSFDTSLTNNNITSTAALVNLTLTVNSSDALGSYTLSLLDTTNTDLMSYDASSPTYTTPISYTADSFTLNVVPEPSTWAVLIIGMAGLLIVRYRRSGKKGSAHPASAIQG